MKKILFLLLFLAPILAKAQAGAVDDTTRYNWYKTTYGQRQPRVWADSVLRIPKDTLKSKDGLARIDTKLYVGNGVLWTPTGGGPVISVFTAYANTSWGDITVSFPGLANKDVLLVFRDGISKQIVTVAPTVPSQLLYNKAGGSFSVMEGDVFGDELITVLYLATP